MSPVWGHELDAGMVRSIASDWNELHAANCHWARNASRRLLPYMLGSLWGENDVEALFSVENRHCLLMEFSIVSGPA